MKVGMWLKAAKDNEKIFRMILDKWKSKHEGKTVEDLYGEYSSGDRFGRWTIVDFVKDSDTFIFETAYDGGPLAGRGRTDRFWLDGEELKSENIDLWMS